MRNNILLYLLYSEIYIYKRLNRVNITKKCKKYFIHVASVDFLQKIVYYAIDNYKIITYYFIGGVFMNTKKNTASKLATIATKALTNVLKADANSTACFFAYQPKAPKELSRFRKQK